MLLLFSYQRKKQKLTLVDRFFFIISSVVFTACDRNEDKRNGESETTGKEHSRSTYGTWEVFPGFPWPSQDGDSCKSVSSLLLFYR